MNVGSSSTIHCFVAVLFYFVPLVQRGLTQQTTNDGCFTRYDNMQVQCVKPFQSRSGATEQQCKDMCYKAMPQCQGAQYQPSNMQCDLFSTMPTGRKKRGGQRTYAGGGQQQYAQPQPQPQRYQPNQPSPYKPVNPQPYNPGGTGQTYPTGSGQGTYQKPGGCGGGYGPSVTNVGGSSYYKPTGQTGCCSTCSLQGGDSPLPIVPTMPTPTTTAVLPPQATCGSGQVVRYMEVKGYQLSDNPVQQFNAANEQECVQSCTNNRMPNGNVAPCQSADFNTGSNQCSFILNASPPAGTGTLTQSPSINHYEKVCLDSATGQVCPGPIIRAPQKILVGYAESVIASSSFADCLQNCVNAQTRFGFKCLSGEFYSTETTDNCILNSESATTQPALYTDENKDKVDYFEPGCVTTTRNKRDPANIQPKRRRNVIWLNKDNWGSWTRCDGDLKTHKRFRQCSSFNPNKCQKDSFSCNPNQRAAEWGAINDEETAPFGPNEEQLVRMSTVPTFQIITSMAPPDNFIGASSANNFVRDIQRQVTLPTRPHHTSSDSPTGDGELDMKPSPKQSSHQNEARNNGNVANVCVPVIKLDGSTDCKHGFRTLNNGRKVPCKPRMIDNNSC